MQWIIFISSCSFHGAEQVVRQFRLFVKLYHIEGPSWVMRSYFPSSTVHDAIILAAGRTIPDAAVTKLETK